MARHPLLRLLPVIGIAGCGLLGTARTIPPQPAPPASTLAGTYELVSIDGDTLPVVPFDRDAPAGAGQLPEILGGKLVISDGGTLTQNLRYRFRANGEERLLARDFEATWAPDGAGYVLAWKGAGLTPATLSGDTLIYDNVGMKLLFVRSR